MSRGLWSKRMSKQELEAATKKKYALQFGAVQTMQVKKKRHIFGILRHNSTLDANAFMPLYGLHFGEFSFFQILSEQLRKDTREKSSAASGLEGGEARPEDALVDISREKRQQTT